MKLLNQQKFLDTKSEYNSIITYYISLQKYPFFQFTISSNLQLK